MTSLATLRQELDAIDSKINAFIEDHEKSLIQLRKEKGRIALDYKQSLDGLDLERLKIAEEVMYVRGANYVGDGDTKDAIMQAIQWFAQSYVPNQYTDLRCVFFGCKNYDRWHCQRDDCSYGYGPRHGSTVFAIGLNKEFRAEDADITDQQRDACIYYLEALLSGKLKEFK